MITDIQHNISCWFNQNTVRKLRALTGTAQLSEAAAEMSHYCTVHFSTLLLICCYEFWAVRTVTETYVVNKCRQVLSGWVIPMKAVSVGSNLFGAQKKWCNPNFNKLKAHIYLKGFEQWDDPYSWKQPRWKFVVLSKLNLRVTWECLQSEKLLVYFKCL